MCLLVFALATIDISSTPQGEGLRQPHLCLRCREYPELPHNLNQSHLGLHKSKSHSNALPWSNPKGDMCTGVLSRTLGLAKPASIRKGQRSTSGVQKSGFEDHLTPPVL